MGRHRVTHSCCVEDTVWLDIRMLRAWGLLRSGKVVDGQVCWRRRGEGVLRIQLVADLRADCITLMWADVDDVPETQKLKIERVKCRFGGWRFYFVCPRLNRRCEVLPLLDGEFASRQAHAISYASQSEGALDRAYRRRDKLRGRLDGANGFRTLTGAKRERVAVRYREAVQKARTLRADALRRRFGMA